MSITVKLYHSEEQNSVSIPFTVTLGMYLHEFFNSAEKIFPQKCISALVLRNGEEIIVLNRSIRSPYMPYYLMKSGDLVVIDSELNNFTQSAVYIVPESVLRNEKKIPRSSVTNRIASIPEYMKNDYKDDKFQLKNFSRKRLEKPIFQQKDDFPISFLILGTLQSGKSTLFKQLKRILHYKYTSDDLLTYKEIIHSNILQNVNLIVNKMINLGVKLENQQNQEFFELIQNLTPEDYLVTNILYNREMATKISALTSDKNFQKVVHQNCNYLTTEAFEYILRHLYRMSDKNFTPSQTDIMVSRIKTTGIVESIHKQKFEKFGFENEQETTIRLIDVGGARNERKKWVYCFDNVSVVFFCSSILDFCRVLYEDGTTNRLDESLSVFENIINSEKFDDTPIVLCFTCVDLLRKILKYSPGIALNYFGTLDFFKICEIVKDRFLKRIKSSTKNKPIIFFLDLLDVNIVQEMLFNLFGVDKVLHCFILNSILETKIIRFKISFI
eukprot:gene10076-2497_t